MHAVDDLGKLLWGLATIDDLTSNLRSVFTRQSQWQCLASSDAVSLSQRWVRHNNSCEVHVFGVVVLRIEIGESYQTSISVLMLDLSTFVPLVLVGLLLVLFRPVCFVASISVVVVIASDIAWKDCGRPEKE